MAALLVEHLKVLISRAPKGPYGRAPKGDGGLNSRACLRIQFTYWVGGLMVEHLKVLISRAPKGDGGLNSRACLRIQFTYLPLK